MRRPPEPRALDSRPRRLLGQVLALAAFQVLMTLPVWAGALPAEYAVRWSPREGGPADADRVAETLGASTGKWRQFEVRYFDVKAPMNAPSGMLPILRERVSESESEVTWKYRGDGALANSASAGWDCPLRHEVKRKDELDISVLSGGQVRRAFSRSCASDVAFSAAVAPELNAKARGCPSTVVRSESKKVHLKIEEWRLSNGDTFIEVSWNAEDKKSDLKTFKNIVAKLTQAGAKPLDRSKTDIGSQCGP